MKLGSLVTVAAGHPFRGSIEHAPGGDVAVVQMKDVGPESGLSAARLFRVHLTGRKTPDFLRQGDLLFVGRGYRIFAVLIDEDLKQTVAGPHFFILRLKKDKQDLLPGYLAWYINHGRAQRYFARHVAGTALPHINRRTLEALPVIAPPRPVQEKIIKTHSCRLKEKIIMETLIEKRQILVEACLDHLLKPYEEQEENA